MLENGSVNFDSTIIQLKLDIVTDYVFLERPYDYKQGGAFFYFLISRFGIEPVKNWYNYSKNNSSERLEPHFQFLFNQSLDSFIDEFADALSE